MKKTTLLVAFLFSFIMSLSAQAKMTTLQQKDFISPDKSKKITLICQHKDGEVKNAGGNPKAWPVSCRVDLMYLKKKTIIKTKNIIYFSMWYFNNESSFNCGLFDAQWSKDGRYVTILYFIPIGNTLLSGRKYASYRIWYDNVGVIDTSISGSELIVFQDYILCYPGQGGTEQHRFVSVDSQGYYNMEARVEYQKDGIIYYHSDGIMFGDPANKETGLSYRVSKKKGYFESHANEDLKTFNAPANPAAMVPGGEEFE